MIILNAFCIGCADSVEFNFEKPFCELCFQILVGFHVDEYKERFCHSCGAIFEDSFSITWQSPICETCSQDS